MFLVWCIALFYYTFADTDDHITMFPRRGFLSKKWIKRVAKEASEINESDWRMVWNGVIGATNPNQDPEELDRVLSHVTDAMMVYDMSRAGNPMVHEFLYQMSFARPLYIVQEDEWNEDEKNRVELLRDALRMRAEDEERIARGEPKIERKLTLRRRESPEKYEPDFPDPRPWRLDEAKERQKRLAESLDWKYQRLYKILTHPVIAKYVICQWYTNERGDMPLGVLHQYENGGYVFGVDPNAYYYPLLQDLYGDLEQHDTHGDADIWPRYVANLAAEDGRLKTFKELIENVVAKPIKKKTMHFIRNLLPWRLERMRKKGPRSLVTMLDRFATVPERVCKK